MKQNMNTHSSIINLTSAGLFAAMITLTTAYIFHIPYGSNGGYIHFGDTLIYLAAVLLPRPYAIAAATIGGGMADLMTAPMWTPATIIIKIMITLPFTSASPQILTHRNIAAPLLSMLFSIGGYFLAEGILFGSYAAALISITGNLIQSIGSALIFLGIATALDHLHIKQKITQLGT